MENLIRTILQDLGFNAVGFLNQKNADFGNWIDDWLALGYHSSMDWMEAYGEIRRRPCTIEPWGRSIISVVLPYYSSPPEEWRDERYISCYAWGKDYHQVVRRKLKTAIAMLTSEIEGFRGRGFVDTAPLPEKQIATKSGLGWIGKNSMLITPEFGSYVFLGEILCNLDLMSSKPMAPKCGSCDRCVNACPNRAIQPDGKINSNQCISYLTIEKRGEFSGDEAHMIGKTFLGCDVCQRVCPWNQDVPETDETDFHVFDQWKDISFEALSNIDEALFNRLKIGSPIKRLKIDGVRRNARAIIENKS